MTVRKVNTRSECDVWFETKGKPALLSVSGIFEMEVINDVCAMNYPNTRIPRDHWLLIQQLQLSPLSLLHYTVLP